MAKRRVWGQGTVRQRAGQWEAQTLCDEHLEVAIGVHVSGADDELAEARERFWQHEDDDQDEDEDDAEVEP